jgi:GT2 family glycosyltransferase
MFRSRLAPLRVHVDSWQFRENSYLITGWAKKSILEETNWIHKFHNRPDIRDGCSGFSAIALKPNLFTKFKLKVIGKDKESSELFHALESTRIHFGLGFIENARMVGEFGIWLSGWTSSPSQTVIRIGTKNYAINDRCAYMFERPDIDQIFDSEARAYVLGIMDEDLTKHSGFEIKAQIVVNGILQHELPISRDKSLNRIQTGKLLLGLQTPIDGLVERYRLVESELLKKEYFKSESKYTIKRNQCYLADERVNVSFVIPFYGNMHFAELHVSSLWRFRNHTNENFEIVFVNDDPNLEREFDRTVDLLSTKYGVPISLIQNQVNVGFSESVNNGVNESSGEKLVLLNSDCFFEKNSNFTELFEIMDNDPDLGLLAPLSVKPDQTIDHIEMEPIFVPEKSMYFYRHLGQGLPIGSQKLGAFQNVNFVTGCCLVTRKNDFLRVGMLDTAPIIGDFEDATLCLQYRKYNLTVATTSIVWATHLGRASLRELQLSAVGENVSAFNAHIHNEYLNADFGMKDGVEICA